MNKKIVGVVILFFCIFGVFVWQKQTNSDDTFQVPSKDSITRYDEELSTLKNDLASLSKVQEVELTKRQFSDLEELILSAEAKIFELKKTDGKFRDVVKADLEFFLEDIKDKTTNLKQKKAVIE